MKTRQIFEVVLPDDNCPVDDFICRLDDKTQKKIGVQLETLQRRDCPLQPPMVKAFRLDRYKGLYELRTRLKKIMIRIIFFFDPDDNIILLHGFVKKQDRATNQALETARARRLALASKDAEVILRSQGGSL